MPLDIPKAVAEIDAVCKELENPKLAQKYARFFVEGYDAYGVDHKDPRWTAHQEEWLKRWEKEGVAGFLTLGQALFATGKYEHGAVAIHFLRHYRDKIGPSAVRGIGLWLSEVRNWGHCDVICGELLSPRLESGAVAMSALKSWRGSPHRFQRRAVPVALLGMLKREFDASELLEFVRPLMNDQEKVVQQGMGWFLRELWKKCPAPVEAFLLEWKETGPRLIFQYATEKMSSTEKARFRRTTSKRK